MSSDSATIHDAAGRVLCRPISHENRTGFLADVISTGSAQRAKQGRTMPGEDMPRRTATIGLTVAIFISPFLALLFNPVAGLGLMAAALIATALLLREAAADVHQSVRNRLRILVGINLTLAVACLLAAAWLMTQA
jgi:hypothetical protein